ncbi:hypothetical protein H9P43_000402 [Blastocladiella emersonii ATCC 22665]|nr:hypothetical protein H9P43_000402 [Blastocladiella emersonii ATCC 22665]
MSTAPGASMEFAPPAVSYACSCSQTVAPITSLLFCKDCVATRCSRCVSHETACYYCPLCLFEVPSSSVKNERNRCARNCFECPVCRSSLSVMAEAPPPGTVPPGASATSPYAATGRPGTPGSSPGSPGGPPAPPTRHYLQCGFCRWDSRETGIVFDRATGLGGSLLKREEGSSYAREFAALKADLEKKLQSNTRAPTSSSRISSPHLALLSPSFSSLQRHLPSLPSRGSLNKIERTGSTSGAGAGGAGKAVPEPYRPQVPFDEARDKRRVEKMMTLQYVEEIPTLEQRLNQPLCDVLERLLPLRTHLRAKLAKRCRQCDKQLIKPEPKAQATRFKLKHVALAHLPALTLAHPMPILVQNQKATVLVRFTNPLEEDLQISLTALDTMFATVHLVCPQFSVPGYDEMQVYDEFTDDPALVAASEAGLAPHGVVQVKGNSVVVEIHVTPRGGLGSPVEFQLIVNYKFNPAAGAGSDLTPTASPTVARRSRAPSAATAPKTMNLAVSINAGSVSSTFSFPTM